VDQDFVDEDFHSVATMKPNVDSVIDQQQRFDETRSPLRLPPTYDSEDVVVALRFDQKRESDDAMNFGGLFASRRSAGPSFAVSHTADRGSSNPEKPPTAMSLRLALDAIAGLVQDRSSTGSSRFFTPVEGEEGTGGLNLGATIGTHEKLSKYDRLSSIG
jgi:hypothetical protein